MVVINILYSLECSVVTTSNIIHFKCYYISRILSSIRLWFSGNHSDSQSSLQEIPHVSSQRWHWSSGSGIVLLIQVGIFELVDSYLSRKWLVVSTESNRSRAMPAARGSKSKNVEILQLGDGMEGSNVSICVRKKQFYHSIHAIKVWLTDGSLSEHNVIDFRAILESILVLCTTMKTATYYHALWDYILERKLISCNSYWWLQLEINNFHRCGYSSDL